MMSRIVRITESDLRAAVADERYWRVGHPERGAFQNWVGQGFRGLNPSDGGARTTVWVRAYMREGHQVSAHWRSAPPRHGGDAATPPGVNQDVIPINRRGGGRPLLPPTGAGQGNSPTRAIPRAPIRDASGRDRVQELRDDPLTEHLPVEGRVLGLYFNAYQINRSLLYSKALDFAVYAFEGIYAVYAGPEYFVRAALPYSAVGAAATQWVRECVEEDHGPGYLDGILEHYAPFMLD